MPQSRPRIGVTRWEDVPGEPIEQYWEQVRNAGGDPVDLNSDAPDPKRLDGLMLTGGFDVRPERYGAEPHPKTRVAEKARDDYEMSRLVEARSRASVTIMGMSGGIASASRTSSSEWWIRPKNALTATTNGMPADSK